MKKDYATLKNEYQTKFNNLPIVYAFSPKQFEENVIKQLGSDTKQIIHIGGGGYMRREDEHLIDTFLEESNNFIKNRLTDYEFMYSAFKYELANHEFCYTMDETDALDALNLTWDDITNDPQLKATLIKAESDIMDDYLEY